MQRHLAALLLLVFSGACCAQDAVFVQSFSNPLQLNPAFAGSAGCSRAVAAYRNQWAGLTTVSGGGFITSSASYDQHVNFLKGGSGINLMHDRVGWMKTFRAGYNYSAYLPVKEKIAIRPGIEVAYLNRKMDWSKMTFGDMIEPRRGYIYSTNSITPRKVNVIDLSAGVLVYAKKVAAGFAVFHLAEPNVSILKEYKSPLSRRYTAHASYLFGSMDNKEDFAFSPEIIFHYQGGSKLYMAGGTAKYKFLKVMVRAGSYEKLIFGAGINTNKISAGYSYDFFYNRGNIGFWGSHEINISYRFNCKNKKDKLLPLEVISF